MNVLDFGFTFLFCFVLKEKLSSHWLPSTCVTLGKSSNCYRTQLWSCTMGLKRTPLSQNCLANTQRSPRTPVP